jgi:chromate reductase, NAD(P)H dehydrogenase (quinone)
MNPRRVSVLTLSGSLRAASLNSAFCRALVRLAPRGVSAIHYAGLGDLPLFNPDREPEPPPVVVDFRDAVAGADALLVASPEYAHGVSGVLKNALDWLVSFEGAVGKPVALINTSPRAHHAHDSLVEILLTMSMEVVRNASIQIPLLGYCRTEEEILASAEVRKAMGQIFEALAANSR